MTDFSFAYFSRRKAAPSVAAPQPEIASMAAEVQPANVGATVADLERSRAFYREFVGLEELPAVDGSFGKTYRFKLGNHSGNVLNLWAAHSGAAANTYTEGIQYVVSDVDSVDARAKAGTIKITQPLGMFGQGLKTVWLADPDGITNYFAQILRTTQR